MTIRVGLNPSGQMYVGSQSGSTSSNLVASGSLPIRVQIAGTQNRRISGSGAVTLKVSPIDTIAVHPVVRRGPGDVVLPKVAITGATAFTQRPTGAGNTSLRLVVSGTAVRSVGAVNQYTANGALTLPVVVGGTADRSLQYVTGTGNIDIGPLNIHDVIIAVAIETVEIEGILADPEMEGVFDDVFEIEGIG